MGTCGDVRGLLCSQRPWLVPESSKHLCSCYRMTLSFINPITASSYRLKANPPNWRIIKSRIVDGTIVVRNLAGIDGDHEVDPHYLDLLIRGERAIPKTSGDSHRAFVAIILLDMDRTCDNLVALVRDADTRCANGCRGFRPQSAVLRRESAAARRTAMSSCAAMAEAWRATRLVTSAPLPEWLVAALSDPSPNVEYG